jgi:DNA repair protein RecN (Recombination protein N)
MLTYLAVKNVSVIESVSLELTGGLTVLTGETGSGKSVLVGALKLLMGERFNKTMLREDTDRLFVEGSFDGLSRMPAKLKEQFEIDDELVLRREVDATGKNRVFINSRIASVANLKEFAPYLADIHSQNEHQALMDESRHIELIDHLVPEEVKTRYAGLYTVYQKARQDFDKLLSETDEAKKHLEIMRYQLNEICSAAINPEVDKGIDEKIAFLSNIEKIREICALSLNALSDGEFNASELIARTIKAVSAISSVVPEFASAETSLNDALEQINDVSGLLNILFERQEASPDELDRLIRRRFMLQELINKYGGSLESALLKRKELQERLNSFENRDGLLRELGDKTERALKDASEAADKLQEAREATALKIGEQIKEILNDLELPDSKFVTVFTRKDGLDSRGGTDGKFYISVNAGFEPAPLAHVASGGEVSRVMLALKVVFSDSDPVLAMLFDEIDTGVSGKTAKKVAQKLRQLSQRKQVIVITHLPVVAAFGSTHFQIVKESDGVTTKTKILSLNKEERRNVIASMIAGEMTESALRQAEELLSYSNSKLNVR